MHKLKAVPAFAVLLSIVAPAARAEPIDTVVVTATRTPQDLWRTGDSVSVITAASLAARQIVSVSDALEQTPGVTIVRNGGPGQVATVSLRGAEAGQTLVLVDGVRINDPSTVDDEAVLGDLFVNNIDRIEVLRGPQSTLYGSDAIGGVVDIITKRGGARPFALAASAEGGSFDTYRVNAAANGTLYNLDYGAAANYFHTNGISAADTRNGNPETDGTGNLGLTANTRYHVTSALSVDLRGYYTRAQTDFDDNYLPPTYAIADSPVYERNTLLAGYAGINLALFDGRLRNRVAYIATRSERDAFDSPSYLPLVEDYGYRGTASRFEYQGIFDIDKTDQVSFGAETQRVALSAETGGRPDGAGHSRITGYYLQGQSTLFDHLTLTDGVRYDDDQEFGGHTSVKLAAAWSPNEGVTVLRANYGDGFKAPTLYELYSAYSNPIARLAPETAHGWEAGADQSVWGGRVRASVTYFDRRTKNLIDFFSCYGPATPGCDVRPYGFYYNVGRSRARGVELGLNAALTDTLSLGANYTYMHAVDAIMHTDLARRPHDAANLSATWRAAKDWSLGAAATYVGRRFDGAGDTTRLPSHITWDLYASHDLNDHVQLFARMENVFDARYEPVAGYGAPGRAVYGGIRLKE